jgi:hypothetical protein
MRVYVPLYFWTKWLIFKKLSMDIKSLEVEGTSW